MIGPDLPAPHELFDVDAWVYRWPSGTHKTELYAGVLVYFRSLAQFDHRDVEIAQRTYPGRRILLNESGHIEIHPAGEGQPRSVFANFAERVMELRSHVEDEQDREAVDAALEAVRTGKDRPRPFVRRTTRKDK